MKFLENYEINRFNSRLDDGVINSGSLIVSGKVELYSCKKSKSDKILSKELKEKFRSHTSPTRSEDIPFSKDSLHKQQQYAVLSPTSPMSPFTPGNQHLEVNSNTLIDLISLLNHIYIDHDFRYCGNKDFTRVMKIEHIINSINLSLRDSFTEEERILLWSSIETEMTLKECEVFEFTPDEESDPMEDIDGRIWSFTYFFVNKKLKKILFFSCYSQSKESFKSKFFTSENEFFNEEDDETNEKNLNFHFSHDEMMIEDFDL
eukprot:gene3900-7113_t